MQTRTNRGPRHHRVHWHGRDYQFRVQSQPFGFPLHLSEGFGLLGTNEPSDDRPYLSIVPMEAHAQKGVG